MGWFAGGGGRVEVSDSAQGFPGVLEVLGFDGFDDFAVGVGS